MADSSNSCPATAASSSSLVVAVLSRASRWLTTSRTPSGLPRSATACANRVPPSYTETVSLSRSVRHSSVIRNALPPVSSLKTRAISGRSGPKSPPTARSTNSEISSALRPPNRSRTTPSERRRSTSVAESASGTSASVSRNVVTSSARASDAPRARCRKSSSVGVSAQCPSSITTTSGALRPTPASRSATAVCRRWRSVSGSAATGSGSSPTRCARSGSSRESSPPSGPSASRNVASSVLRTS